MDLSECTKAEVVASKWVATPGIHEGVPNDEYHADTAAVSSSRLKPLLVSPAHFIAAGAGKETKAKSFGSALHCLLLEPEKFEDSFMVLRASKLKKSTKEGQALAELVEKAAGGREIVSEGDFIEMQAMVASAKRHGAIRQMLEWGQPETTFVWHDDETGLLLKCRTDWLQRGVAIWDVKTANDGSVDGFSRACAQYDYHLSAAMYGIGVQACTGERRLPFRFAVLEKGAPYAVAVYEADSDFIRRGEKAFRASVRRLAECRSTNQWPGYQRDEIELIGLPPWK